ncbi:GNAT family N-acetyltransferase [Halogeometricum sp. S1BR25-6]|uniref:GNAT family N-acetyltransferase n=1 Tax=Halogeometricum salsisoli TaxID=2950536 RepID=A0ABU2GH94_9EURY|nr:GNAT family N-acetyltransferase [Halogeometricum sp. S1BR25-6]MDS0299674.1 GNAT family N-acetyltransferase [Halogeometricum sp. S1BR25-6]
MHLRQLPEDHRDAFRGMVNYAFRPEDGPDWEDRDREDPDLFTPLGFYDAPPDPDPDPDSVPDVSTLRSVCGSYDFTVRVRGEWRSMPGVSAVASPPEGRRQGTVGAMLDALLTRYREEGAAFSTLWPFEYPFYRRLGWATCCNHAEATLPPGQLADVVPDPRGEFRRLTLDEDLSAVRAVHEAWATESLAVRRTEGWWRERVFRGWQTDPYVFGWFDGEESLRGYLVYTIDEDDGDGRTMRVWERAAADDEARGHLLRFCRDHDSQVESVTFRTLPEWARPIDELPDPRAATLEVKPGPMVRVVDVAEALSTLSYDARESVVLDVDDDRCAWNDGTFELRVDAAGAHVRRLDGGAAEAPDAELDIGALSQLTVGARDAAELERAGDLTVADASVRATLDALFPRERAFLREGF